MSISIIVLSTVAILVLITIIIHLSGTLAFPRFFVSCEIGIVFLCSFLESYGVLNTRFQSILMGAVVSVGFRVWGSGCRVLGV